mmetsp:Transcript_116186/g.333651  ORF Transcript_116186/g.333651 Transcript_116186/m.333651 type:complete len:89 (+) Transcript_116186:713-979(+)
MWAFGNIDLISCSDLISLNIQGNCSIGSLVSFTTQLFWSDVSCDTVIIDDREIFASNTHDDTDLIGRPATTEHNQVIESVSVKRVSSR